MSTKTMWASLMIGIATSGGCESAAERCNVAKVAASDAWSPIEAAVREPCALFAEGPWDRIESDARMGLNGLARGMTSDREVEAINISMCTDSYRPVLRSACRGASSARVAATQGAVAARDAASSAEKALAEMPEAATAFAACVRKVRLASYKSVLEPVAKHAASVANGSLTALRSKAAAASTSAFERCQRVSP